MKVAYTITPRGASLYLNGRMRNVASGAEKFNEVVALLRQPTHDLDLLERLVDWGSFVARATFGAVQISDDQVRWNGTVIGGVIVERLLAMLKAGEDLEPLALFLNRLMQNPLESAREELYLWLEEGDAPITPTGTFLAFKKVGVNYKDLYSGKFDNSVGQVVSMPREEVDPDRHRTCSQGLHFCSYGYLSHYHGNSGRVMIVEIDPADVVAVPSDYSNQKGRTWKYVVIGEVPEAEAAKFFSGVRVVQPYVYEGNDEGSDEDFYGDDEDEELFDPDVHTFEGEGGFVPPEPEVAPEASPEVVEEPVPEQPAGKASLMFQHGTKSYLAAEVVSLVNEHGQRGTSRMTGVPRTTLQDWVRAIRAQAA